MSYSFAVDTLIAHKNEVLGSAPLLDPSALGVWFLLLFCSSDFLLEGVCADGLSLLVSAATWVFHLVVNWSATSFTCRRGACVLLPITLPRMLKTISTVASCINICGKRAFTLGLLCFRRFLTVFPISVSMRICTRTQWRIRPHSKHNLVQILRGLQTLFCEITLSGTSLSMRFWSTSQIKSWSASGFSILRFISLASSRRRAESEPMIQTFRSAQGHVSLSGLVRSRQAALLSSSKLHWRTSHSRWFNRSTRRGLTSEERFAGRRLVLLSTHEGTRQATMGPKFDPSQVVEGKISHSVTTRDAAPKVLEGKEKFWNVNLPMKLPWWR